MIIFYALLILLARWLCSVCAAIFYRANYNGNSMLTVIALVMLTVIACSVPLYSVISIGNALYTVQQGYIISWCLSLLIIILTLYRSRSNCIECSQAEQTTGPNEDSDDYDDLTRVEGIDLDVQQILYDNDTTSYHQLADIGYAQLLTMLTNAGDQYATHDPLTWSQQARMLVHGELDELDTRQSQLKGSIA